MYRFTRFGLVTRAAAETEKGAFVSGIAPDRIAAVNWMISAAVAGMSGILIAPIVPPTPIGYTLFIVPALAAAIIGRFKYMVPAVLAGLAIGMLQSESVYLRGQHGWLPTSGLAELVPLLLILLVLVASGAARCRVAARSSSRRSAERPGHARCCAPRWSAPSPASVALVLLQGTWRAALITSLIFAIIALSLVVVTGYAGQISLAQLTLAGVAGFLLGPLTTDWELPLIHTSIPSRSRRSLAALGATVVGVVVGLPALRIRGLPRRGRDAGARRRDRGRAGSTTPTTSARAARTSRARTCSGSTSAPASAPTSRACSSACSSSSCSSPSRSGWRSSARSRLGSAMLAVRANERSAAGAGIDVVRVKLIAFAIAAFIAGLGGAMLAYFQGNVTFDSFTTLRRARRSSPPSTSAGITSVSGGIVAGMLAAGGLVAADAPTSSSTSAASGTASSPRVVLVFTIIKNPEGIVGPIHDSSSPPPGPTARGHGSATQPPPDERLAADGARRGRRRRPDDRRTCASATAASSRSTASTSRSDGARSSGSSVRTAPARRRCSTRSAASLRTRGASSSTAVTSPTSNLTDGCGHGSGARSSRRSCTRTCRSRRTSSSAPPPRAAASRETSQETLELLDLVDVADRPGRRALTGTAPARLDRPGLIGNPEVLLLDEPAGGLDSHESQWLGQRLRRIRDSGVTIVLIDHDMHLVLNLCDAIYVLDFGLLIAHGPPSLIKTDRTVADAYLGSTHAEVVTS